LELSFFGLTSKDAPELRLGIFNHIHEIIFYGKGGYDYETIYNMPIWLRAFTWTKINDHYEKENENRKKSSNPNTTNDMNRVKEILQKAKSQNPKTPPQNKQLKNFSKPPSFPTSKLKVPKK
tara:strand:+ start:778 stop:1143 length:366 start_codon:yes stop_codon:yes gene_type:complete